MLIIVGPSATGKTVIVSHLQKISNLKKLVTYTTRNKREGEVNDVDYHFISKEEFINKIDNGFFFEYVCYHENYYGTALSDLTKDKVVILEPNGLKKYKALNRSDIKIIYLECSEETRRSRMAYRGDKDESINDRIIGDRVDFSDEFKSLADIVLSNENKSLEDICSEILEFYSPFMN